MGVTLAQKLRALRSKLALCDLRDYQRDEANSCQPNTRPLIFRLFDSISRTWDLGFTAFGGPPVHLQIMHRRFVKGTNSRVPWVDEQTVRHNSKVATLSRKTEKWIKNQEIFAVCQALPGPASTKMLFCLKLIHDGLIPAICGFFTWSLPGAVGMYSLSLGVGTLGNTLPGPVYGMLSGLNASTVGIIALAAVQLASRAIADAMTRVLVIFGACAGLCYSALWYFPVVMVAGGLGAAIWDVYLSRAIGKARARLLRPRQNRPDGDNGDSDIAISLQELHPEPSGVVRRSHVPIPNPEAVGDTDTVNCRVSTTVHSDAYQPHQISFWLGITIIVCFFVTFAGILAVRSTVSRTPLALDLFANMYLAGTIIFGGGPVVIPLLREYVVQPGWVSGRDFLIGLAIIQSFPGPNFNFAVYLSALAVKPTGQSSIIGALVGYFGIFVPGMTLALGFQGLWHVLRTKPVVISVLRGVNATAVGLIFTAVYRLWELGYLTPSSNAGQSLALEPWWVVVAAISYSGSAWFNIPPPAAIIGGGVLGLLWYAAVGRGILFM